MKKILIRANAGKSFGFGHLRRMLTLADNMKGKYEIIIIAGGDKEILLPVLLKSGHKYEIASIFENSKRIYPDERTILKGMPEFHPDLIVLDTRDSSAGYIKSLRRIAPVLTIDNHGKGVDYADVVISSLPVPRDKNVRSNYSGSRFLILYPDLIKFRKDELPESPDNVYISFGGQDPYNLTEIIVNLLPEKTRAKSFNVILGPLYKGKSSFSNKNINIIRNPENFHQEISKSDLLITSFGLTLYEALAMNIPVMLFNPTYYHQKLTETEGNIISLGTADEDTANISSRLNYYLSEGWEDILHNAENHSSADKKLYKGADRIIEIIESFPFKKKIHCPVCKSSANKVVLRNEMVNSYMCTSCKSFFRADNHVTDIDYDDNYFTDGYKTQYGKTYEEDRAVIDRFNRARLNNILEIVGKKRGKLLEAGCALGFFLDLAKKEGFDVSGVEISKYASDYAVQKLGISVKCEDFHTTALPENSYDVIAAWYVIEHSKNFAEIIMKMKRALKPGGVIALSTPNGYGLTARAKESDYYRRVPQDHYVEFSTKGMSILLSKSGFKVMKIANTGIHYKRFLDYYNFPFPDNEILAKIYSSAAELLNLGDTFEIYAVKS